MLRQIDGGVSMTPLIFECPRTRRAIDAGIQTDKDTLAAAGGVSLKIHCSHCGGIHELPVKRGRLAEAWVPEVLHRSEPPKAPALAIAINALRIFWLQAGLAARDRASDLGGSFQQDS
jgi:hypothetical protein